MLHPFYGVKDNVVDDQQWSKNIDQAMLQVLSYQYRQLPLTIAVRQYCLDYCRQKLGQITQSTIVKKNLPAVPFQLIQLNALCFISIDAGDRLLRCQLGRGKNIIDAIDDATQLILKQVANIDRMSHLRISIAFLFNETVTYAESIRLGIHGLSLRINEKVAYFKNAVPIHHNLSLSDTLKKLNRKVLGDHNNRDLSNDRNILLHRYDALEFTEDSEGNLNDLFRGNSLILQSEIDVASVQNALHHAVNFLIRMILPSGEMIYRVFPSLQKMENDHTLSALTRKIASLWQLNNVITTYHHFSSDILNKIKLAIRAIVARCFTHTNQVEYVQHLGKTHLGMNSLLLLTIMTVAHDEFIVEKTLLLSWIESQLSQDKKYFRCAQNEALMYPAQAILALMAYDKTYVAIAESVFPYYRQLFQSSDKKLIMCPWFSKVYSKVFLITKQTKYADFIFEMNDHLLPLQIPAGYDEADVTGAFTSNGNVRTTAAFSESLLEAYAVANQLGDTTRCAHYKNSIRMAIRALLQLQLTPENCHYTAAIGGFKNTIFDNTVRIDNVQHALHVLLASLQIPLF